MPGGMRPLLFLLFLAFDTAATRFTIGMFQLDPLLAPIASLEQSDFKLQQTFAETSCTWCCWECLTELEATRTIIDTLMNSSSAGQDMTLNRSWLLLVPPYMLQTLCPLRSGVNMCTLNWPCLGKQLRPRKLRPQARPHPRYRRPRKRTLTWRPQVAARLIAVWDSWPALLAPCAHQLQNLCRVLLLQGVVPWLRLSAKRCANAQAVWGSANQCVHKSPHSTQAQLLVQTPWVSLRLCRLHLGPASYALPHRLLWFRRPQAIACNCCLHSLTLRFRLTGPSYNNLPLPLLRSATMGPLRDPLHDSVLDEALADTGLPTASVMVLPTQGKTGPPMQGRPCQH